MWRELIGAYFFLELQVPLRLVMSKELDDAVGCRADDGEEEPDHCLENLWRVDEEKVTDELGIVGFIVSQEVVVVGKTWN
jgi:hypothetical protein